MFDFFQDKKWLLYAILAIILIALIAILAYYFFTPGAPRTSENGNEPVGGGVSTTTPPGGGPGGQEPPPGSPPASVEDQKLLQVTDFSVVGPALNKTEDKILYYKKEAGHAFASDIKNNGREEIFNVTLLGIVNAYWSPAKDRAAVTYLDQETLKSVLEIGTSSTVALPSNLKGFSWAPNGKSAAYLLQKDKRLYLTTIDASGKKPKTIYRTSIPDAQISWVGANTIAFQSAPSGTAQGSAFLFSTVSKTLRKVVGPLYGLMSRWSPDAKTLLVSSTEQGGSRPAISLYDSRGKTLFKTQLETLASKCVFSADSKFVYCALPRTISANTVLPDDYLRGEFNTSDRIVSIDIAKKTIADVFDEGNFDMSDLVVTKNRDYLFFVNRGDGTLWRIKLK